MDKDNFLEKISELLTTEIFAIAGTSVSGATLITFLAIVGVSFWVAGLMQRSTERLLSRHGRQDEGTAGAVSRLLRYIVLVLGLGVGFHTIGINLSALFAAGALFAVAIGFAMQNIVANFVSGIILLSERTIKPRDIIEVEGRMVRITDIGIRATRVRTLDSEDLLIPNSVLVQSTVKNHTLDDRLYRLRIIVGVAYESDLRQVREVLQSACDGLQWRSEKMQPVVLLADFASSSVNYEVSVWVDDPWQSRRAASDVREAIWWAFQDAEITIAFPQVDVHFDMEALDQLAAKQSPQASDDSSS